jgi:hypothetical protein
MAAPLTVAQILEKRGQKIEEWVRATELELLVHASLTDDGGQTTSVNVGITPTVLTIISWNVQTFEGSKSLGSPYVNKVINGVLDSLSADVCFLLETRTNSYINMNAIETGFVGSTEWKQPSDDADEDDPPPVDDPPLGDSIENEQPGVDDDPDDGTIDEGGVPPEPDDDITYIQIASEMTGKHYRPPNRIFLYEPAFVQRMRMYSVLQDYQRLLKKQNTKPKGTRGGFTKKDEKNLLSLQKKHDRIKIDNPGDYALLSQPSPELKRFAGLYAMSPKFLKPICVDDNGNPTNGWIAAIGEEEVQKVVFTYYNLMLLDDKYELQQPLDPTFAVWLPADNWRVVFRLKRCEGCGEKLGTGKCSACEELGAYTTTLQNLKGVLDTLAYYRSAAMESYSVLVRQSAEVFGPSTNGIFLSGKQAAVHQVSAGLVMYAPPEVIVQNGGVAEFTGRLLNYQVNDNKGLGFYGRCPFRLTVEFSLPGGSHIPMPMVAFHGPFGASTIDGVRARAAALRELMNADVGVAQRDAQGQVMMMDGRMEMKALRDVPFALVLGDFNLDWSPDLANPDTKQGIANQLYADFDVAGFKPIIEGGVATSLLNVYAEGWKQQGPDTIDFTSSAYDNFFLHGDSILPYVANAAAIDVLQMIADHLVEFPLPANDPLGAATFDALSDKQKAFYIYHRYVSDHLPIVCDIMVAPMTEDDRAAHRLRAQKTAMMKSMLSAFDVWMSYVDVTEFVYAKEEDLAWQGGNDFYLPVDDSSPRIGKWLATVFRHEDQQVIVRCEPVPQQVAWWAFQPPQGVQVETFLAHFPPFTRISATMVEPKPIEKM